MRAIAGGMLIAIAAQLAGCSAPAAPQLPPQPLSLERERQLREAREAAEAEHQRRMAGLGAWEVGCSDDYHGTAERRCSVKNGHSFQVVFVDGRGPYVQVGESSHIDKPNVVRVDSGRVHIVSESRNLLPAGALVSDLLRGKVAYATWYDWPYDTPHHSENNLAGFKEAYAQLLKLKASHPPRPQAVAYRP
jgi:hypothetical protein